MKDGTRRAGGQDGCRPEEPRFVRPEWHFMAESPKVALMSVDTEMLPNHFHVQAIRQPIGCETNA
jgi:hypothetical protein